jgi:hypothetical protein
MWQTSSLFFLLKNFSIFGQFFFPFKRLLGTEFFLVYQIEKICPKKNTDSKGLFNGEKMALFARFLKKFTHH